MQSEKQRKKWKKNRQPQGLWDKIKWSNIYVIGVPEGKESENRAKKSIVRNTYF